MTCSARALPALLALASLTALAAGCGPDRDPFADTTRSDATTGGDGEMSDADAGSGDGGVTDVPIDRGFTCTGNGTDVRGTALTPNGEDPVPGAVVYLIRGTPPPIDPGVACDTCQVPPGTLAFTQTGIDGRFVLSHALDEGGMANLVIQKGRFRRIVPLTLGMCTAMDVARTQTALPGRRADGDIPRILVATQGTTTTDVVLDSISRVIERVGITEYDHVAPCRTQTALGTNLTSSSCELGSLLANRTRLFSYNIIFIPCGALGFNYSWQLLGQTQNAAIVTNVRDFLERGGRLYSSDTAYGLLERAFPEAITFAGGTALAYMGRDPANVGSGGSPTNPGEYSGMIADPDLSMWLRDRGALAADGTVNLTGFISPWAAIDTVATTTKTWVRGAVNWFPLGGASGTAMPAGVHPLTVSADFRGTAMGCGRAVFTSYHVDSRAMGTLTPQERVLEWLLFELGGCVMPPG